MSSCPIFSDFAAKLNFAWILSSEEFDEILVESTGYFPVDPKAQATPHGDTRDQPLTQGDVLPIDTWQDDIYPPVSLKASRELRASRVASWEKVFPMRKPQMSASL